jgi:hypothetical protein
MGVPYKNIRTTLNFINYRNKKISAALDCPDDGTLWHSWCLSGNVLSIHRVAVAANR